MTEQFKSSDEEYRVNIEREKKIMMEPVNKFIAENADLIRNNILDASSKFRTTILILDSIEHTPSGKLYASVQTAKDKDGKKGWGKESVLRFWIDKRLPDEDGHFDSTLAKIADVNVPADTNIKHDLNAMKNWEIEEYQGDQDLVRGGSRKYYPELYTLKRKEQ